MVELPPGIAPGGEPATFQECLTRVNPSEASLQQLSLQADDSPIIMLNMLRFRPRGDSTIYGMYGREAAPEVEKVDSFVAYFGTVITSLDPALGFDTSWDALVMPVYHRRASYLALQNSSVYHLAIPYRTAGTSRRTLYVLGDKPDVNDKLCTVAELDASRKPLPAGPEDVYVVDIVRFCGSTGQERFGDWEHRVRPLQRNADATPTLSLTPETPVLSEEFWEHCTLTRFPSLQAVQDLYASKAWQEASVERQQALENSITLVTSAIPLPV